MSDLLVTASKKLIKTRMVDNKGTNRVDPGPMSTMKRRKAGKGVRKWRRRMSQFRRSRSTADCGAAHLRSQPLGRLKEEDGLSP